MSEAPAIRAAADLLRAAIARRVFPAAAVAVGSSASPLWSDAFGALTFDAGARPATIDTIFDLASLTKPIATTTLTLELVARQQLALTDHVDAYFPDWRREDRLGVTVADLLEHASGLPARLVDRPPDGRREFEHDICLSPLAYVPRTRSIYSDLGFILLGFLTADRAGDPMDRQFARVVANLPRIGPSPGRDARGPDAAGTTMGFGVSQDRRANTAPTEPLAEDLRQGRRLIGEVHDAYAAVLGGVAGHAGLFGSALDVAAFARSVLVASRGGPASSSSPLSAALVQRAIRKSSVPGSSRALGWDTMLATSSCGNRMSDAAFGHVGFTGTSLWIDPVRDRYFVLLTNRACAGGTVEDMRAVRRAFHDALAGL